MTRLTLINGKRNKTDNRSLSTLKRECRKWNEPQWEAYLCSIESPQRERLYFDLERVAERQGYYAPDYLVPEETKQPSLSVEEKASIRFLLYGLSRTEKTVLQLLFWGGLNDSEAAEKLGISRRSVRTHLGRAIKKLRALLSPPSPIRGEEPLPNRHEMRQETVARTIPITGCSQLLPKK